MKTNLSDDLLSRSMDRLHVLALAEDATRDAEDLDRAERANREAWATSEDVGGTL